VDRPVGVSRGVDAIVCVREAWSQRSESWPLWLVEHLGFQLGELVLQFGEVVGQGLHDAGVDRAEEGLIGGAQVL